MESNGIGAFFVFLVASYPGLIVSILAFFVSVIVLIIKRKKLNNVIKMLLLILAIISAILIGISVYLSFVFGRPHSVAIIGGSDGPTAIYIDGSNDNIENKLKFNGVYYLELTDYTVYFRFYDNGKVIELTSIGKYNETILKNLSYEYYDDIIGNYTIENNSINFTTYSGDDIHEYFGIITDDTIIIKSPRSSPFGTTGIVYSFKEVENYSK